MTGTDDLWLHISSVKG